MLPTWRYFYCYYCRAGSRCCHIGVTSIVIIAERVADVAILALLLLFLLQSGWQMLPYWRYFYCYYCRAGSRFCYIGNTSIVSIAERVADVAILAIFLLLLLQSG